MSESNVKRVELLKADSDESAWYFRAVAGNGEVVAVSEMYSSRANARRQAQETFPGATIVGESGATIVGDIEDDGA